MPQVKIGPSFFAKAKNDYSNWMWAWIRELSQNSIDAPGSKTIKFNFTYNGEHTIAICENNGAPMTKEVITDKFLALGGSGKNFQGSVGGFGKAKELIAFVHDAYTIRTGTLQVEGSGADYEIQEDLPYIHGTTTTIKMPGDIVEKLVTEATRFVAFAQWAGTISINGEQYKPSLRKGSPRRDLGFGTVYTNKVFTNRLIVRIGGIPMFHQHVGMDRCVVLELDGTSLKTLSSNRDSLKYPYCGELSDFITELSVDKQSALRNKKARYRHYEGEQLKHTVSQKPVSVLQDLIKKEENDSIVVYSPPEEPEQDHLDNGPQLEYQSPERAGGRGIEVLEREEVKVKVNLGHSFILKNETGMTIPNHFTPEEFSDYSKKLVKCWAKCMMKLHEVLEVSDDFSVGFVFSESCEAEAENADYGRVYYINPAQVVQQRHSQSRSFRKRFKLTERHRILSIAAHEMVHGGFQLGPHNEEYANKLTDVFGIIMARIKDFNECFR